MDDSNMGEGSELTKGEYYVSKRIDSAGSALLLDLMKTYGYDEKLGGRQLGQIWDQIAFQYNCAMPSDRKKTKYQLKMYYNDKKKYERKKAGKKKMDPLQ